MADYTVEWRNGAFVRVPKVPATRVVTLDAGDVRQPNWRVWSRPRGARRPGEFQGGWMRTGVSR